jgi:hypothetical protein
VLSQNNFLFEKIARDELLDVVRASPAFFLEMGLPGQSISSCPRYFGRKKGDRASICVGRRRKIGLQARIRRLRLGVPQRHDAFHYSHIFI